MAETKFAFVGVGGSQLSGHLEPPEGTPRGWAIFAHCFTCGKDSRAAVYISRALSRAGIGVLRFDFAGIGAGSVEPVSFASDVEDIRLAAMAMTEAGMPPSGKLWARRAISSMPLRSQVGPSELLRRTWYSASSPVSTCKAEWVVSSRNVVSVSSFPRALRLLMFSSS